MTAADNLAEALREIERLSHNRGGDVNHVRRMFGETARKALAAYEREKAGQPAQPRTYTCNLCGNLIAKPEDHNCIARRYGKQP